MMAAMNTSSLSLALVALACLAGCRNEAPAQSAPPTSTTPTAVTSASPTDTGDGSGAASSPRCETDADCVVSCARPADCCDQLCPPCDQAFHRDELAALQQWRAQSCAAASCPVAKCMAPKEESVARCASGQCLVQRVPRAADQ
ncbi:hypothetical protein BE17_36935 [Sorangium cellulosum]|uniref:Secreted protein n=1 Tax=Sorangium cellulosum TaxID=56 RepID=A0A150QRL4_SORCE|nr:hypothetical protein BE17_36935 [Sorangium cellulosum]